MCTLEKIQWIEDLNHIMYINNETNLQICHSPKDNLACLQARLGSVHKQITLQHSNICTGYGTLFNASSPCSRSSAGWWFTSSSSSWLNPQLPSHQQLLFYILYRRFILPLCGRKAVTNHAQLREVEVASSCYFGDIDRSCVAC